MLTNVDPYANISESLRDSDSYGRVVELVDSLDSGSSVHCGRAGSSPASPTKIKKDIQSDVLFYFRMRDLKGRHAFWRAKKCPVDTFLVRGKVPLFSGAVRRTVNENEKWLQKSM